MQLIAAAVPTVAAYLYLRATLSSQYQSKPRLVLCDIYMHKGHQPRAVEYRPEQPMNTLLHLSLAEQQGLQGVGPED